LAKSKSQKEAMLAEYMDWLAKSKAVVLVEYAGLKMKDLDAIRAKARENGGEFHIVKNTLAKLALEKAGYSVPADFAEKSTAIGFAFTDAAGFTKALTEATKGMEAVKMKGGFLDAKALNPAQVKSLASLHSGRTRPFIGIGCQSIFRQGCTHCSIRMQERSNSFLPKYYSIEI
jgi:large subunit ribosomal protein L10